MPQVEISPSTFRRLQQHAAPLFDNMDTVINRALDALDEMPREGNISRGERIIDPEYLPDLTYTKVLDAAIDRRKIEKPTWTSLLHEEMIVRSKRDIPDFEAFWARLRVRMVSGRKENKSWTYVPELGVSVIVAENYWEQYTNSACRAIIAAAQRLGLALDIGFAWHDKAGAAHPGERGRISVPAPWPEHKPTTN